jgi:predicted dehydrogenase
MAQTPNRDIKFLIAGCGSAGRSVARVLAQDGRVQIAALVDPQPHQLEKQQALYPDAATGSNFAELLDATQPDAVVVAGPDHLHADQTLLAIERGCHVLVEKPLTTTVADARRVIAAAESSGLHVMTDHTVRYLHPWGAMARAAREGQIGEIFFIQGDYIHDMWGYYAQEGSTHTPWRADQTHPQNILLGGGCHPIDLILWTIDSPVEEVFAYSNKLSVPEFPADDCYMLSLRFANGALGKVFVTSGCSGHGMGGGFLAVYGTEGSLWQGELHRRGEEPVAFEDDPVEVIGGHGWAGSVSGFLDALEGKAPNPIPARFGAKTVAVCEAAFASIASGRPQKPEEF